MKNILIITIPILLFTSLLYGQTKKTGVLYLWKNGTKYMGEWKDGTIHGQGIFTSYAGRKYIGQWKDGNPWHGNVYDENGVVVAFYLEGARTENQ